MFSTFQHRAGPWPVKSRQHRKAKSHSAQAAVDGILGNYSENTPFQGTCRPLGLSPTGDPGCCSAGEGKDQSCRSLRFLPLLPPKPLRLRTSPAPRSVLDARPKPHPRSGIERKMASSAEPRSHLGAGTACPRRRRGATGRPPAILVLPPPVRRD